MNLIKAYVNEILPGGFFGNDFEETWLEKRVRLLEEKVRALESRRETPQDSSQQVSEARDG